jgi:hypothetical protein
VAVSDGSFISCQATAADGAAESRCLPRNFLRSMVSHMHIADYGSFIWLNEHVKDLLCLTLR